MGNDDNVGFEVGGGEQGEDILDRPLRRRPLPLRSGSFAVGLETLGPHKSSVREKGERVNDKDALWAPGCRVAQVNVVVFPIVEHFESVHKRFRFKNLRSEGRSCIVIPQGTEFHVVNRLGALRENKGFERVEAIVHVQDSEFVVGGDKRG